MWQFSQLSNKESCQLTLWFSFSLNKKVAVYMSHADRCSDRIEMVFLREKLNEAFFLSIVVVGSPHGSECGILWACGSRCLQPVVLTFFMGERKKAWFLKVTVNGSWKRKVKQAKRLCTGSRPGTMQTRGLISRKFWCSFFTGACWREVSLTQQAVSPCVWSVPPSLEVCADLGLVGPEFMYFRV